MSPEAIQLLREIYAFYEDPARHCARAFARNAAGNAVPVVSADAVSFCTVGLVVRGTRDASLTAPVVSEVLTALAHTLRRFTTPGRGFVSGLNDGLISITDHDGQSLTGHPGVLFIMRETLAAAEGVA